MKILMVLGRYLPFKNAGIENYTHTLVKKLTGQKHEVQVAVLESEAEDRYVYEEIPVTPLQCGYRSFAKLVNEEKFDICHFQEYSGSDGINLKWFEAAKTNCGKVFFTFHLPYLTCYKLDFRYFGIDDCHDFTSPSRCVKCIIATKLEYQRTSGFNIRNSFIQKVTPLMEKTAKIHHLKTRIEERKAELDRIMGICDCVFIYAAWFKSLLNENGYTGSQLVKIPYVTDATIINDPCPVVSSEIKNKILFVGRIEKQKGLLLLCKAMNLIKKQVDLDVYGNVVDEDYHEKCKNEYDFNFKGTLPLKDLLKVLDRYDFLVMPSVFTEMSSMMIKDAFNCQLPVIASAAKGNKDVIREGRNGFIFEYGDYKDLTRVIDQAYGLKQKGWQPEFDINNSDASDVDEILSYYSIKHDTSLT